MGIYLNPGNEMYKKITKETVFIDHSKLIDYTNYLLGKKNCYTCVSRPRRFGKSTDVEMLCAYYSKGCDSSDLFSRLKIAEMETYKEHLNKHNVIHLNMQNFLSDTCDVHEMIQLITDEIKDELFEYYSLSFDITSLPRILNKIYAKEHCGFIFLIDEWDCIFREYREDKESQKVYLDYLRNLFKDQPYIDLVYMTGILPIKKYGTHSAINMFQEISVIESTLFEDYFGFTEDEVHSLCNEFNADYGKMKEWYDGYRVAEGKYCYNPLSVVCSLTNRKYLSYWTQTETYEALKIYIDMNFDGLKEAIISLLTGENVPVNPDRFQNDMTSLYSKDDVLTLMIHLGYLGYNSDERTCYIPNKEVRSSFVNSVDVNNMKETAIALQNADNLLKATWEQDEQKVAELIEEAHLETSHLQYNDENALSYTISLAYYTARNEYTLVRELPAGKGFADMAFIPKGDKPAMVVELKWDKDADTAISQIKEKKYPKGLEKYTDNMLLVGISYDTKNRKHSCKIEQLNG